ncbi:RodZ domain-containing protein [uncultured Amphritea sp.]|uniref:RodZ domain-containing protein n=1 Tax=uncultured Amphritea sp. TaxID=981605 RepID=UPI00262AD1E6|nr:RodZ domain-containing protein [uncultured Amphritea sp.]
MSNEQLLNQDGEGLETDFPAGELAVARELQGLTKNDVARELRLSEKYIDSLERGAFNELPSMVFARGYVQSYTKLLKLDSVHYLGLFDRLYGRTGAGAAPQFRTAPGVQSTAKLGDPVIKWSAWIFVLVIIAATVWWWKIQQGVDQPVSQLPVSQSVEVESVDGSTLIIPSGVTEVPEGPGFTPSDTDPAMPEVVAESEDASAADTTADSSAAIAAEEGGDTSDALIVGDQVIEESDQQPLGENDASLRITFIDECWVSVEDHAGKVLAMRVKPAGSELSVVGETPIKLLLGRAEAVGEVFFNGSPIEFNRDSRSGVVRLTLPL